ncbi:hypothetical protein [Nocardia sp. NPDC049707]|uniref:hypothetical protein n=1 Tax=Nocardia sp. NPDC049707 TaxID=3154735 RepID=UPI003421D1EF
MNIAELIAKYEDDDHEMFNPDAKAIYGAIRQAWRDPASRKRYWHDYDDQIEGLTRLGAYIAVELGARARGEAA